MLQAGMQVGSVRLLRPLEEGGMGSVWVGEHLATRQEVAVKFMLEEVARAEPTARDRFHREASVLRRVRHDRVVHLFEQGALADGTPYLVMELLAGESLVDRLMRTEKPMSLSEATALVTQVCEVLEHIHGHGIVHRDLKGENTFLTGTSGVSVKILDFGLAKTPDLPGQVKLTMPGQAIGSPEYMSPEQIMSSGEVDVQADLWAVGVLAYVALTLEFPFKSETLVELLTQLQKSEFTPASKLHPGLPAAVDAWFTRAFHLEKVKRFGSAREMADAWIAAAASATPVVPRWLALAAVVAIVAGVAALLFW